MSEDTPPSVRDLTVDEFTHGMRRLLGEQSGIEATIKIAFEGDRVIFIDGKSTPNAVTNEDQSADVTLRLSLDTFNKLYRRELNPMMAAMSGKIRIEGDLRQAMKLEGLLKPFVE